MSWIANTATDEDLAGFAEWWQSVKGTLRTEAEKISAFIRAAGELRSVLSELPALRRRTAAIVAGAAALPLVLAPEILWRFRREVAAVAARQATIERNGAGLIADANELAGRVQAGARGTGALMRSPAAELGELGGWFLVLGLGAALTVLTGSIAAYLAYVSAHKSQIGLTERLLEDVRAGRISVPQAITILEAAAPKGGGWFEKLMGDLGEAGGLIAVGAVAAFVLPMLLGGRRR